MPAVGTEIASRLKAKNAAAAAAAAKSGRVNNERHLTRKHSEADDVDQTLQFMGCTCSKA